METQHYMEEAPHGSLGSYIIGFILSVVLTLFAFWSVPTLPHVYTYTAFAAAALLQLIVQLVFFLHIASPSGRNWNLIAFMYALVLAGILVGGTLWIMHNLAHRVMLPEMDGTYLNGDIAPQNSLD